MFNTLGQSPCVVASYLQGACLDTVFNISALPANQHYVGPLNPSLATECACSSVTYVLVSGCGACQGADITQEQKWSNWITNCSSSQVAAAQFPHRFSNRTRIPAWAFEDVVQSDEFDLGLARTIANSSRPEVGPDGPITPGKGKKSGPNIGAIVGGVIGGLALVGIVAAITVYLCLRHRRSINRPAYSPAMTQQNGFLGAPEQQPYGLATPYSLPSTGSAHVPSSTNLYDPHIGTGNGSSLSGRPQSAYSGAPQYAATAPPHAYSPPPQAYSPPPQAYPPAPAQHPYAAPPVQPFTDQQRQAYTGVGEL